MNSQKRKTLPHERGLQPPFLSSADRFTSRTRRPIRGLRNSHWPGACHTIPSESLPWKHRRYMEGRYANYFKVGFNEQEIVIDFGQHHGGEETLMHTRIVISRAYLSTLIAMLEASSGRIENNVEARQS